VLFPEVSVDLHYWPSQEGGGSEVYLLTTSTAKKYPQWLHERDLSKYAIEREDGAWSLRPLWQSGCDGPVGDVEIDFDGDNVVDIVCFSGLEGNSEGWLPLVVVSGATGKSLGKLEGEEFVVTQSADGVRTRSMEIDVRANEPRATVSRVIVVRDQAIAVEHSERTTVDRTFREPFQPLLAPGSEAEAVRALGGRERLLDHFVALKYPGATSEYFAYRGIRSLRQIGAPLGSDRSTWPEGTRILLDYTPPRATAEPATPVP
jgi:hypothetical protein